MNRGKIAHITTVDGSLRYLLLAQLQSLQRDGYEVVAISAPGPDVGVLAEANIRHIPVPMTRRLTPLADLVTLWRLYRVMRKEKFALVHTHTPKPGLLGQLAARMAGVPVVVNTLHGFYFHDNTPLFWKRFYICIEKVAALCSDIILSQNHEDIVTAIRERICQPGKIKFLGNGIDSERFRPSSPEAGKRQTLRADLGFSPDTPVIGFVGRLVAEKGVLDLLRAAKEILHQRPDVRFLFVGPADSEKADGVDQRAAEKSEVDHACVFTGERQDMVPLYAAMDLFVLPSYREGFPRAAMEACAMGLPCVVSNIRGCREIVEHGQNGTLFQAGDSRALAAAILEILGDPGLAASMGKRGQQLARERFDQEEVFQTVKEQYARLLFRNEFQCREVRMDRSL